MRSVLIVLILTVFALGELAGVVQKNRNRRAGQADGAEPARNESNEKRVHPRGKRIASAVAVLVAVIVAVLLLANTWQTSHRDVRALFSLPLMQIIVAAAVGLYVRCYRAEVKEWEEMSGGEDAPSAPPEKEAVSTETAQKKREESERLLEAGLLTKEEYRERLKKLE